ncbi:unnamed protein product [Leptidea sinapis]|uniref:Uncharacterized protein n=1 Tax=Leptidea sinapis TaxID=189913 RepID=A0A5E4R9P9_9NEOP|nr:unnamed protein product [Leptidea sinapis]
MCMALLQALELDPEHAGLKANNPSSWSVLAFTRREHSVQQDGWEQVQRSGAERARRSGAERARRRIFKN